MKQVHIYFNFSHVNLVDFRLFDQKEIGVYFQNRKKIKDTSLGRPSASLAPLLISILSLFQILTQSPRHVLA